MKSYSLLMLFLLLCFSFSLSATPLLSSKAIRIARQAKEIIHGGKKQEVGVDKGASISSEIQLKDAAQSLEALFNDPSFRRLDTSDQVDIIVLLSNAYERLGEWQKQEKLLSVYSKKREFHRYYITLQIELAKSHVLREQYLPAEKILSQLMGKSCARYPLEEKQKIAAILLLKDRKLFKSLQRADSLKKTGLFEEASLDYQIVLEATTRNTFPFQVSKIQRKQLQHKILLAICECLISTHKYQECLFLIHNRKWEMALIDTKNRAVFERKKQLIIGFANLGLQRYRDAYDAFLSILSCEGQVETPWLKEARLLCSLIEPLLQIQAETDHQQQSIRIDHAQHTADSWTHSNNILLNLWNALFLYACEEDTVAEKTLSFLETELKHSYGEQLAHSFISGFTACKTNDFLKARELLNLSLTLLNDKNSLEAHFLRVFVFQKLSEIYFSEATFYYLLGKNSAYQRILKKLDLLAQGSQLEEFHKRQSTYYEKILQKNSTQLTLCIRDGDQCPFTEYESSFLNCISYSFHQYNQALQGKIDIDESIALLSKLKSFFSDYEGRAIVTHTITDIWIQTGQYYEAFQSIEALLQEYPSYSGGSKLIAYAITSTKELHEEYFSERRTLISTLYTKYSDSEDVFFTALIDPYARVYEPVRQEQPHTCSSSSDTASILHFCRAITLWEKGQEVYKEAKEVKEPFSMKEKYELSFAAYRDSLLELEKSLVGHEIDIHDPNKSVCKAPQKARPIIIDLISLIDRDVLFYHFKVMARQEAAYNELHNSLFKATQRALCHRNFFHLQNIQIPLSQQIEEMLKISPIYLTAFLGNLQTAKEELQKLMHQDPQALSPQIAKVVVFLSELLRESGRYEEELSLMNQVDETLLKITDNELSLQIAIEKARMYRELKEYNRAMAYLGWAINDSFASSLRIRAMLIRADIYLEIDRTDLAIRQLEAIAAKGGEWAQVAQRKLEEIAWR